MKTCPVCKERSFDDAEVCYGCLHRFGREEGVSASSAPPEASERTRPDQREAEPERPADLSGARAPAGGCASELVVRIELPGFVAAVEGPRPRAVACAR